MKEIRFSDQSAVVAALAVSEHTDNDALIIARENFILAAKLAHGDEFNDFEALYEGGSSVLLTRPTTLLEKLSDVYGLFEVEERGGGPWARLLQSFKR